MIDGELKVIAQAWAFQKEAGITERPVLIENYLKSMRAEVKVVDNLRDDEAGQVLKVGNRLIIVVNGRQSVERQRFTILHEIAHIRLNLPSTHANCSSAGQFLGHAKRPREEILCDLFAAECLLPHDLFKADVWARDCSFASVQELADLYQSSLSATGSRFAAYSLAACCWVLTDNRYVRYASCSAALRSAGFFLRSGTEIPKASLLGRLWSHASGVRPGIPESVPGHIWIHNGCDSIDEFTESAVISTQVNQGVALLVADLAIGSFKGGDPFPEDDEDELLPELDGQLKFPGKRRRR